ncbi:MAG: hydrogenase maturation nickel metallochaperone HypA, partial [Actinomycetota bacterium]
VLIPVRVSCSDCGDQTESADVFAVCRRCGSSDLQVEGGDDLMLESIEVRRTDPIPSHAETSGEREGET